MVQSSTVTNLALALSPKKSCPIAMPRCPPVSSKPLIVRYCPPSTLITFSFVLFRRIVTCSPSAARITMGAAAVPRWPKFSRMLDTYVPSWKITSSPGRSPRPWTTASQLSAGVRSYVVSSRRDSSGSNTGSKRGAANP